MTEAHVHLAYDGSLHGDWVSRYAIRLAAGSEPAALHLVHVDDGALGPDVIDERIGAIEAECTAAGVHLDTTRESAGRPVDQVLTDLVPARPGQVLVCGTRARDVGRGLLAGTVSARLLAGHHDVLAVRVLDPGNLGSAHRVVLALSGNPRTPERALPFLRLMRNDIVELTLHRVATVSHLAYRQLTLSAARKLEEEALAFLRAQAALVREGLGPGLPRVDVRACVSDDWPKEVVITATRLRARHILLGASERSLPRRFFLGNPLEQVLRNATCDVSVFHAGATAP